MIYLKNFSDLIISYGNNYRLKNVLKKAKTNQSIKIVFLGASVTAEPFEEHLSTLSFTSLFNDYFNRRFGKSTFVNAGICGSNTVTGLYRTKEEVLIHDPDIVFIDFGISDFATPQLMECYEGMLRMILDHGCAVIPLYMTLKSFTNSQAQKIPYDIHYSLPVLSIRDILRHKINNGEWTWEDYSSDYAHPTNKGHEFISECIAHFFEQTDSAEHDPEYHLPPPMTTSVYENVISESNLKIQLSGNNVIEKSFFCQRAIIFFYIHSDNRYGCIDIFVDGKYQKTIDGYNTTGWGNRESDFIFSSNKPENHTFTLKMSQGDKNKIFDLDGFCYC